MKRYNKVFFLAEFFFYFSIGLAPFVNKLQAQIAIGKPNLGFTKVCASPIFNTFDITFSFNPVTGVNTSTQFIVELSDATGSFTSPVVLHTSATGSITASPAKISFAVPTTVSGENYRVRIRSTAPTATSQLSNPFPAYYKPQDSPFTINNSVASVTFCSGSSYLLSIDPLGTGTNDSPLKYSGLTFNWFKDNGPTTLPTKVGAATEGSYAVTSSGTYYVETNYGTCTSDSYSNRVAVTASSSGATALISSSLGNPFCESQGATVLTATKGKSYQWTKDNVVIAGATNQTYAASTSGKYSAKVSFDTCEATANIDLEAFSFLASFTITKEEMPKVVVTTDATNPSYKWFLNDVQIPNVNSNTYSVTTNGNYKVAITQSGSCIITKNLMFAVTDANPGTNPFPDVAQIPNIISPNGDSINDTWVIPLEYVNGSNAEVLIISVLGDVVLQTKNYQNDWPNTNNLTDFKDTNPVYYYIITTPDGKLKKGSITLIK